MSDAPVLGPLLHAFFVDHLITVKGLRPASVRSYRDTVRLLLVFVAADRRCKISRLALTDLTFGRVLGFLRYLEDDRHNHIRTRNQRLAALHTLFEFLAGRAPEMLGVAGQVAAIPMKRVAPPETRFLERDEVEALLAGLPKSGRNALRDRALLLFLYNTGARVAEVADLRAGNLDLGEHPRVRLHGKGDKWRTCPLWSRTAELLRMLLRSLEEPATPETAVFSAYGRALTRFGIYKLVRRHAARFDDPRSGRRVSPHVFRHTAAVHLLEAGVEVNVIRGWLGHADLATTNRYAEINTRAKEEALRALVLRMLRRHPARRPSGGPTNRSFVGLPRSDRYVPGGRADPRVPRSPPASSHITEMATEVRQPHERGAGGPRRTQPDRERPLHGPAQPLRVRRLLLRARAEGSPREGLCN